MYTLSLERPNINLQFNWQNVIYELLLLLPTSVLFSALIAVSLVNQSFVGGIKSENIINLCHKPEATETCPQN